MKKLISAQRSSQLLLVAIGAIIAFHLLVIAGLIPANQVWSSQPDEASILPLELISIVFSFSFGLFTLIKMRYVKTGEKSQVVTFGLWVITAFLFYNSVANLISELPFDNFFFAPLELLMALLTLRLAVEK